MKYSLRSLMIVVTLIAVAAAFIGREVYCQNQVSYHEREMLAIGEKLCPTQKTDEVFDSLELLKSYRRHERLANSYRDRVWFAREKFDDGFTP